MNGSTDLQHLLREASPLLDPEPYVFLTAQATYGEHADWQPIAVIAEEEGLTLIVRRSVADERGLRYDGVFSKITLQVHSSLNAVGLTARFTQVLAAQKICANVVAGYYHDHIFVAQSDGQRALAALAGMADDQARS